MNNKILFVDDEPNVLQSIRRSMRNKFDIDTAESGVDALDMVRTNNNYSVIISDMRMPRMSGLEFLTRAKQLAPDTVRMMLTGNADQKTAVDAVNVGDVFRFLTKPCQTSELEQAVNSGIRQYELVTAEKVLLEKTLRGSIKALSDVLALTNPEIFGRATRFRNRVREMSQRLKLANVWQIESVALLSQIGCTTVSEDLVKRRAKGEQLDDTDYEAFAVHAKVGAELIESIPRMEEIAAAIRYQEKNFDGSGYPQDDVRGKAIPFGARILKAVLDCDAAESRGMSAAEAVGTLKSHASLYDPEVLKALEACLAGEAEQVSRSIEIGKLTDTMVLAQDVRTQSGVLLVAKGQETSLSVRRRLQSFQQNGQIGSRVSIWNEPD